MTTRTTELSQLVGVSSEVEDELGEEGSGNCLLRDDGDGGVLTISHTPKTIVE